MPAQPLISVIVNTYNQAPYLAAAIDSVLNQSLQNFELIVVDDGSTDESESVLAAYSSSPVQVLRQQRGGPSASLNAGLARAAGRYVALLDGDDVWYPRKLERHAAFMETHLEADITFSWSEWIDECGRRIALPARRWTGPVSFQHLFVDFVIGNTSSMVFRKAALDRAGLCDPSLSRCYDVDLCLRLTLLRENNCHAVPEILTAYRRHSGQMSRDWRGLDRDWRRLIAKFHDGPFPVTEQMATAAICNMRRYCAFLAYEAGDFASARELLRESFAAAPADFLADSRNWKIAAAVLAGLVLPTPVHAALQRAAGISHPSRRSCS